jgi:hypothetical protein
MPHRTEIFALLLPLLAIACGGRSSEPSSATPADAGAIPLRGTEVITLTYGEGGSLGSCPEEDGTILSSTIDIDLGTSQATLNQAVVACGATTTAADGQYPTTVQTQTVSITPSQQLGLTTAIEALDPQPSPGCGADGDSIVLTVDRGGGDVETYETIFDVRCEAPDPVVDYNAMGNVYALASKLFPAG